MPLLLTMTPFQGVLNQKHLHMKFLYIFFLPITSFNFAITYGLQGNYFLLKNNILKYFTIQALLPGPMTSTVEPIRICPRWLAYTPTARGSSNAASSNDMLAGILKHKTTQKFGHFPIVLRWCLVCFSFAIELLIKFHFYYKFINWFIKFPVGLPRS